MDVEGFGRGMRLLSSVFDPDTLSGQKAEDRSAGYWVALGDQLEDDEFWAACLWAARRYTFFPKPAELLAYREAQAQAAAEAETAERRRIGAEYYGALNDEVDARDTAEHPAALERLRLATAAFRGVPAETLVLDTSAPALTRDAGAAPPSRRERGQGPLPIAVGLKAAVVDLAARRATRRSG